MRYASLFSGIEAASCAWVPLGWEPVAFSEIDPFPCAVLAHRYPEVPNLGDVTEIDWKEFERGRGVPDVVVGGSPCQSFSVAGKREGLAGASGLMWEFARACAELRPRWVVWENVPGALSSSHGEDFRCLVASLDELGYCVAWRVLDAQWFGVAQRRRRVFVVASLGDARAVEVLFEPECLRGDTPPRGEEGQEAAVGTGGGPGVRCLPFDSTQVTSRQNGSRPKWGDACHPLCASASPPLVCMASASSGAEVMADKCPTLLARACNGAPVVSDGVSVRRLTPTECERLQGFPDGWTDVPYRGREHPADGPRYKALGNSMAVPVVRWIGERMERADALREIA